MLKHPMNNLKINEVLGDVTKKLFYIKHKQSKSDIEAFITELESYKKRCAPFEVVKVEEQIKEARAKLNYIK